MVTDITRTTTVSSDGDTRSKSSQQPNKLWTRRSGREPSISTVELTSRQALSTVSAAEDARTIRLAVVQSDVFFTDVFVDKLRAHGIVVPLIATPELILRRVSTSPGEFDQILYPISSQPQMSLEFSSQLRCLRESSASFSVPRLLVLSFENHYGVTVQSFMRTVGTRYARFISGESVIDLVRSLHDDVIAERAKSRQLHLRFVHSGNPNGLGCIRGEKVVAAYASFDLEPEEPLGEAESVLRFLNLLAMCRLSKSAPEIVALMRQSPLYIGNGIHANVLSVSCIKTYIRRADMLLVRSRHRRRSGNPPIMIERENRGGREVGYKLRCTVEVEHV